MEDKSKKAYLVWVLAVCPKTGICVWQPHRCSGWDPGTPTTAPLLSGCPATSALGWQDSAIAKIHRHRLWGSCTTPISGAKTCASALETTTPKNKQSSSKPGQGLGLMYANTLKFNQYYTKITTIVLLGLCQFGKSTVNRTTLHSSFPPICKWSWLLLIERSSKKGWHATHALLSFGSQPATSLSGLMLCSSNVGTKEITSRMETRQTNSLRKEQNLNLVRAGKKVNQERKPLGMPSSWTTPPPPHPDTPPETNLSTRTSRIL